MSTASSESGNANRKTGGITWGAGQAISVAVVIYVVAQFIAIQVAAIYPALQGWSSAETKNWLANSVIAQFIYILLAEGITVISLVGFIRWRKGSLRALGLKRPKLLDDAALALVGLLLYVVAYIAAIKVFEKIFPGLNVNQEQAVGFTGAHGVEQLTLVFCSLVILPPLVEEFIFRGFLFSTLKKSLPLIWAVLLTSALFAAPHLLEATSGGALWIAGIDTFVLSLILCWLRQKTGRLYAGMGVHALKNGVAFFVLFIAPQLHWFT